MRYLLGGIIMLMSGMSFTQAAYNMEKMAQWNPPNMPDYGGRFYNDVWGYATQSGEEYAILGNADSILIVDVTIPQTPIKKFSMYGGNKVNWRDFKTYKNYAYGVCDNCNEGLHIFDMGNLPSSVSHVLTTTSFFESSHNIFIDEQNDRLYAVGVSGATDITILDLTTPASPTLLMHVDFNMIMQNSENYYVHDVFVRDNIAYCSHGGTGYYIWDMNDLNNITLIGKITEPIFRYNHSSWITDDNRYAIYAEEVPTGNPMVVVDLANVGTGTDLDKVATFQDNLEPIGANTPHNPFIKGDTLIISYYEDGVKAYDISNPTVPILIAYYDTYPTNRTYNGYEGCWGVYPYLPSGHILASDRTNGLFILNMIPPPNCDFVVNNYNFSPLGSVNIEHHVLDYIDATGSLQLNSRVDITAKNYLELQPGFTCNTGSLIQLQIGDCIQN